MVLRKVSRSVRNQHTHTFWAETGEIEITTTACLEYDQFSAWLAYKLHPYKNKAKVGNSISPPDLMEL